MATSLTGSTPGTVGGSTYLDLLHTFSETRATGAQVAWGNGEGSALVLWTSGVGVMSGDDQVSKLVSLATAARTITIPDTTGTMVLGDGTGISSVTGFRTTLRQLSAKTTVETVNSTVTPAAVSGFTVNGLAASKVYHVTLLLRAKSSVTGTGFRFKVTGPAEADTFIYQVRTANHTYDGVGFDTDVNTTTMATDDTDELIKVEGLLVMTAAAGTSPIGISIWSETPTVDVTLGEGSLMIVTEY
jgi:hypothetical protein